MAARATIMIVTSTVEFTSFRKGGPATAVDAGKPERGHLIEGPLGELYGRLIGGVHLGDLGISVVATEPEAQPKTRALWSSASWFGSNSGRSSRASHRCRPVSSD